MRILFVASELNPLAKVGGLGDVAGALPKDLKKLNLDVRVVLPRYDIIDEKKYRLDFLGQKEIKFGRLNELIKIYITKIPDSDVLVYLLENKNFLTDGGIYFEKTALVNSFKEIQRFLFFSKTILEIFSSLCWQPEVIHCQDWHVAIVPLLLKSKIKNQKSKRIKTLLTIHNLANQGRWRAEEFFNFLGMKGDETESLKLRFGPEKIDLNLMQQGIYCADLINTVSPSYAQEILTPEFGEGLEKDLQKRKNDLFGILNGLDLDFFNPARDPSIKANYSIKTLEKKRLNKKDLQRVTHLSVSEEPLFGFVGRLTNQKGSELVYEITDKMIKRGSQFVFLGQGQDCYENQLLELAKKYPKNVYTQIGFDAVLAQKIYAGADIFLMPSRFEPCGLGQMIAMRYGTVPIVRNIGGLKDSVKDVIIKKDRIIGNGFVFKNYQAEDLLKTIERAIKIFSHKKNWRTIQENGMKSDFSWENSAQNYLKLYKKLC